MSLTRAVPFAVPSLFHSSLPWAPSSAAKNSVPPTAVRSVGAELFGWDGPPGKEELPGQMSLTITVPLAVPSLFHSSRPWAPSSAVKNRVPLTAVRLAGAELLGRTDGPPGKGLAEPGKTSLTRAVPLAEP